MTAAITKIAWRVALLAVVLSLVAIAAELSGNVGITYATGGSYSYKTFDLEIDSKATYNGVKVPGSSWKLKDLKPYADRFFKHHDVKPGDRGEATISLHVNKDAWICLEFENVTDKENGENEPEALVDTTGGAQDGELAEGLEFFSWHDDGDNKFEVGEKPIFGTSTQSAMVVLKNKTYALADYKNGSVFKADKTRYIGIEWCAGDMTVNVAAATVTCNGAALGNEAQTDSFSVDVSFEAVSAKDEPKFTCVKQNPHNPPHYDPPHYNPPKPPYNPWWNPFSWVYRH